MSRPKFWIAMLFGTCCAAPLISTASASVVIVPVFADITNKPYSFSFGSSTSTFTFSNTGDSGFGSPVAVSTTGGAAVRTIFGGPSPDFDAPRNATPYDGSMTFTSFATATPIPYSGPPSFIGLVDRIGDDVSRFGYAEFSQNRFVSYGYETDVNTALQPVSLLSTVPLPASAPMFGAALLGLAGLGYAAKRKKAAAV